MAADRPANAPADAGAPAAASAANDASAGLPGPALGFHIRCVREWAATHVRGSADSDVRADVHRGIRPALVTVEFLHSQVAIDDAIGHHVKHG